MSADRVLTWEAEGHKVTCHESSGDRLWHCTCADFMRRLTEQKQGYCKHTAFCMMRAYAEGVIDLGSTLEPRRKPDAAKRKGAATAKVRGYLTRSVIFRL